GAQTTQMTRSARVSRPRRNDRPQVSTSCRVPWRALETFGQRSVEVGRPRHSADRPQVSTSCRAPWRALETFGQRSVKVGRPRHSAGQVSTSCRAPWRALETFGQRSVEVGRPRHSAGGRPRHSAALCLLRSLLFKNLLLLLAVFSLFSTPFSTVARGERL